MNSTIEKEIDNKLSECKTTPITLKQECLENGDCNEILKNLYLGGLWVPKYSPNIIDKLKITHILNVTADDCYEHTEIFMRVPINDDLKSSLITRSFFDDIHNFIEEGVKKGIYIHCNCGVSRSATIVISYLMKIKKMSLIDSFWLVKSKRDIIQPNACFMKLLIDYEYELTKKNTLTLKEYTNLFY